MKVGDIIKRDQHLVDIETDEAILEIIADHSGQISKISINEGDKVAGEQIIGAIKPYPQTINSSPNVNDNIDIVVPILPNNISTAHVAKWYFNEGDKVEQDQLIVDIETDKVVLEVVAPSTGVIADIKYLEGSLIKAEQKLATLTVLEQTEIKPKRTSVIHDIPTDGNKVTIVAPILPNEISEATVAKWHCVKGEMVTRDQALVDLETDKVVLEIVAQTSGIIVEINQAEASIVTTNQTLGILIEIEDNITTEDKKADIEIVPIPKNTEKSPIICPQYEDETQNNTKAIIGQWHVVNGQKVEQDQNIVDIETDKVVLEVVTQHAGIICDINLNEGDTVNYGQTIAYIASFTQNKVVDEANLKSKQSVAF